MWEGSGSAVVDQVVRRGLMGKFHASKDPDSMRDQAIWISGRCVPGSGNCKCKGPGAGACLVEGRHRRGPRGCFFGRASN